MYTLYKELKYIKVVIRCVNRRRTDNTMAKSKKTKGQEEFEDIKVVIRSVNRRRTDNTMAKRK